MKRMELASSGAEYALSTRNAYIKRLKDRRLIEEPSRGSIRMADALSEDG